MVLKPDEQLSATTAQKAEGWFRLGGYELTGADGLVSGLILVCIYVTAHFIREEARKVLRLRP